MKNTTVIDKMDNKELKIFVTGVAGQLGFDVVHELNGRNVSVVASDLAVEYSGLFSEVIGKSVPYVPLDITDAEKTEKVICELKPNVIIHCAAWTAVDLAEDEDKRDKVFEINGGGTANIARAAKKIDAKMIYISTDYVFDGNGQTPWKPDQKDYAPLNVYGESKLKGELAVATTLEKFFIVRIAWVFGKNGKNFIKTMLNVGKKFDKVRVVNDQIGTPTYTFDLAKLLADMARSDKYGYYHATNEGEYISWFDFTKEIYKQAKLETEVVPVSTEEYGLSKAKRPFNSRLDKSKLAENGFRPLPDWRDALNRYLKEIGEI